MVNLLIFCRRAGRYAYWLIFGTGSMFLLLCACQRSEYDYYNKGFTVEEQQELAKTLTDGIGSYYQGSPACQQLLEEARKYDPNYALAVREIGVPYLKRGITAAFPHYYGKAADLDPLGWTGWRGYLYLYFYRDYERALVDFNALDTITPGVVDYPQSISVEFMRGLCYLELDKYDEAIDYFDRHIAHEDSVTGFDYIPPETFLYRGIAYWKKGERAAAISSFKIGLGLEDFNADLQYWLARMYIETEELSLAQTYLNGAKAAFEKGDYNKRYYVEEFYQLYEGDFTALAARF